MKSAIKEIKAHGRCVKNVHVEREQQLWSHKNTIEKNCFRAPKVKCKEI